MTKFPIALLLLLFCGVPGIAAGGFHDLGAIDRQVAEALGAGIGEPGGAATGVDRRLRLATCPATTIDPPLGGAVTVRCPALGWRLRVALARGGALGAAGAGAGPAMRVRAEPVIRRGDPVEMAVETGAFTVSMQAIAEQDGAPGDRIRVRADAKSTPRMAEVIDRGRVRIGGFK
jgi:flagella basal body P-ring formation protein FlgA